MRRIFASGFRAGFVLSFRWIPSELNNFDKGSRFLNCDYDSIKSLCHVQRLTRTSPSRASDQDCSSPSPMHLDGGQVDFRSHVPVSGRMHHLMISRVSRGMRQPSHLNGLPFPGHDCIGDFGMQMLHGSMTFCGLPPGLVVLQFLDESQMQWSSVDTVTGACHTRSPTKISEKCPDYAASGRSSRRQTTVVSDLSSGARRQSRRQSRSRVWPAGKEEDSDTSDENGPPLVPNSARVVSGRQHHCLRMLVDHLMCRDGRSEESLPEQRAERTLAARRNYQNRSRDVPQICKGARAPSGRRPRNRWCFCNDRLVQGVQHHPGSQLLAVMDRWPSFSRFGSSKLPRFFCCLKVWRQLTPARTRRAMPAPVWEGIATQSLYLIIPMWHRSSSFSW